LSESLPLNGGYREAPLGRNVDREERRIIGKSEFFLRTEKKDAGEKKLRRERQLGRGQKERAINKRRGRGRRSTAPKLSNTRSMTY